MKIKNCIGILVFLFFAQSVQAQNDYRQDSLQFKMYTRLYINENLRVDSMTIRKIFCDYCTDKQLMVLRQEALRQTEFERYNPRYRKPGEHRLALYVRFSKEDFKGLNNN